MKRFLSFLVILVFAPSLSYAGTSFKSDSTSLSLTFVASSLTLTGSLTVAGVDLSSGSVAFKNSSNVASAATVALPTGNIFHITGIVSITTLNTCDATNNGRLVLLIFDSTASLADGNNLKINGVLNGGLDDTISLICDGTNWFELSRQSN